jgi:hypothetical protein
LKESKEIAKVKTLKTQNVYFYFALDAHLTSGAHFRSITGFYQTEEDQLGHFRDACKMST